MNVIEGKQYIWKYRFYKPSIVECIMTGGHDKGLFRDKKGQIFTYNQYFDNIKEVNKLYKVFYD